MKKIGLGVLIWSLTCTTAFAAQHVFGTGIDRAALTAISEVVASPDAYLGKVITVQGKINSVCSKRGCWMQLQSDQAEQQFKIKVRDGDMVFPVSAKGKTALATGQLSKQELDLESTREHFAELAEKAGTAFDPTTVTTPLVMLQLVPTGVEIQP